MRRIDLAAITLESWSRLDDRQRQRFAEMFLRAAVRLGGPELRRWLRRRVRTAPLAAPIDPACFAISDVDIALLLGAVGQSCQGQGRQLLEPAGPVPHALRRTWTTDCGGPPSFTAFGAKADIPQGRDFRVRNQDPKRTLGLMAWR